MNGAGRAYHKLRSRFLALRTFKNVSLKYFCPIAAENLTGPILVQLQRGGGSVLMA